jgi:hypothetical protein
MHTPPFQYASQPVDYSGERGSLQDFNLDFESVQVGSVQMAKTLRRAEAEEKQKTRKKEEQLDPFPPRKILNVRRIISGL